MYPIAVMRNKKELLALNERLFSKIKCTKCKDILTGRWFLCIQNKIRYILGTYDIWESKDGDKLEVKYRLGSMLFVFQDDRYWLLNDYTVEPQVKEAFLEQYPKAKKISFIGNNELQASLPSYEIKFKYAITKRAIRFEEILRTDKVKQKRKTLSTKQRELTTKIDSIAEIVKDSNPISIDIGAGQPSKEEIIELSEETAVNYDQAEGIKCTRPCYFQENRICRYFDWELKEPTGQIPDCTDPFSYIEQLNT